MDTGVGLGRGARLRHSELITRTVAFDEPTAGGGGCAFVSAKYRAHAGVGQRGTHMRAAATLAPGVVVVGGGMDASGGAPGSYFYTRPMPSPSVSPSPSLALSTSWSCASIARATAFLLGSCSSPARAKTGVRARMCVCARACPRNEHGAGLTRAVAGGGCVS